MPHYYFNVYDDDTTLDQEGMELTDEKAARTHALNSARSLAAETARHGHLVGHHRVEYVDEGQNPLGEVRFDEAVDITP